MAYLSDYEHDIFVSYADSDLLNDWSRRLVEDIRKMVATGLGLRRVEEVDLWMDYRIRGNEPLTRQLRQKAERSAVLLVLMSEWYLESSWCGDELEWFVNAVRQKHADRPVFVVRVHSTDHGKWPRVFKDERGHPLVGYDFVRDAEENALGLPKGYPRPEDASDSKEYYDALLKLASDIVGQLKTLRPVRRPQARSPAIRQPKIAGERIFLAAAPAEDVDDLRDELAGLLRAHGCTVVPETNPLDADQVHEEASEWISKCDKFVQVLGSISGSWRHDKTGFVMYQHELAKNHNKPIFVYRARSLETSQVKKPEYRDFIERFDQDDTGGLQSFADRVVRFAKSSASAGDVPQTGFSDASERYDVFISYAREDALRASDIVLGLQEQGYSVFLDVKIPPGRNWYIYIKNMLEISKCVVVLWSHHSINADNVFEEADYSKKNNKIIPLLIDKISPPFGFSTLHSLDLSEWSPGQRSRSFDDLLRSIGEFTTRRS